MRPTDESTSAPPTTEDLSANSKAAKLTIEKDEADGEDKTRCEKVASEHDDDVEDEEKTRFLQDGIKIQSQTSEGDVEAQNIGHGTRGVNLLQMISKFRKDPRFLHATLLIPFFMLNFLLLFIVTVTDLSIVFHWLNSGHQIWGGMTALIIFAPFLASLLTYIPIILSKRIARNGSMNESGSNHENYLKNVLWQFPIIHPIMNLRLFFSLLLMDTQHPSNQLLVSKIKNQVLPFGFFHAFLSAAPQIILQASLVFRTGYITPSQLTSLRLNFVIFTISTLRLYFYQRLGRYKDTDPSMKHRMLVFPLIVVQNIGILTSWIFIASYFKEYILICIVFVILFVFIVLYLWFSWPLGSDSFSTFLDGVPSSRSRNETLKTFAIALLTSWVSPLTVWSNNQLGEIFNQQKKSKAYNRSAFLLISSVASIAAIFVCLVALITYSDHFFHYDLNDVNDAIPYFHCLKMNLNLTAPGLYFYNSSLLNDRAPDIFYICTGIDCINTVRICDIEESQSSYLNHLLLYLICGLLIVLLPTSYILQRLGDYDYLRTNCLLKNFRIFHPSILQDQLQIFLLKQLPNFPKISPSLDTNFLIENSNPSDLNAQIQGMSTLEVAYQKGFFETVIRMIDRGGNPSLKNENGESILSLVEYGNFNKIKQMRESRGDEIVKFTRSTRDKQSLTFVLTVSQLENEGQLVTGSVEIIDGAGKILHCDKITSANGVAISLAFIREAGELSENIVQCSNPLDMENASYFFEKLFFEYIPRREDSFNQLRTKLNEFTTRTTKRKPPFGSYLLHKSIKDENKHLFTFLHNILGANLGSFSKDEETALQLLINNENKYFKWIGIKNGGLISTSDETKMSELLKILKEEFIKSEIGAKRIENLRKKRIPSGLNILFLHAARKGMTDLLQKFLDDGYSPNLADESGRTGLHYCAQLDKFEGEESVEKSQNKIDAICILLQCNAKVEAQDNFRQRPIHVAAKEGNYECLDSLINKGKSDVNAKGEFDQTPLHFIVSNEHLKCLNLLIESQCDVNCKDQNKQTPLHIAASKGSQGILQILVQKTSDLNARDKYGRTPLHLAVINGKIDSLKILLGQNQDTDSKEDSTNNKVADPNIGDLKQQTPLHLAAENGHLECLKFLLENRANLMAKDENGKSPLDLAVINNHSECVDFLERAIAQLEVNVEIQQQNDDKNKEDQSKNKNTEKSKKDFWRFSSYFGKSKDKSKKENDKDETDAEENPLKKPKKDQKKK